MNTCGSLIPVSFAKYFGSGVIVRVMSLSARYRTAHVYADSYSIYPPS